MPTSQKISFARSLEQFAQRKILDAIQIAGKALPARVVSMTGSIATVAFEVQSDFTLPQVTIPMFGPQYVRYPMQPGDLGIVLPADAFLGGITGLGSGVATLDIPANLAALVFLPIANTAWAAVDPDATVIYGPNGVVLRDSGSGTVFTLTPSGVIVSAADNLQLLVGANSITITSAGIVFAGPVTFEGAVSMATTLNVTVGATIAGKPFISHEHSGVQTGSGNTGGVV